MLSLMTLCEEEVGEFFHRLQRVWGKPSVDGRAQDRRCGLFPVYRNGKLDYAGPRGAQGDDITNNVRTIPTFPSLLKGSTAPRSEEARSSCSEGFARLNEKRDEEGLDSFANPRNNGRSKSLDPKVVASRPWPHGYGLVQMKEPTWPMDISVLLEQFQILAGLVVETGRLCLSVNSTKSAFISDMGPMAR